MPHKRIILFLILSVAFATTHYFAGLASLYWYFWWFDILMHFWGGILIGLGVHVFGSFSVISIRPNLLQLLVTIAMVTLSWEIFERVYGLYNPDGYILDTVIDISLGFSGGLLAHVILRRYTMK